MSHFLSLALCLAIAEPPRIEPGKTRTEVAVTITLPADSKLPQGPIDFDAGEKILRFSVVKADGSLGIPLLGSYERQRQSLTFKPRFPLEYGKEYRAVHASEATTYRVPNRTATTPPRILAVVPGDKVLPANVLKFYIYFSAPMQGGQALFKQIVLIGPDGKLVEDPWLTDELWDENDQRLILYIHPGRIKWGVKLRESMGPVLYPDRDYKLILKSDLKSAEGQEMGKDHVLAFRTAAEDRTRIELNEWSVLQPRVGSHEPVKLTFPKSIDRLSLARFLKVEGVAGKIDVAADGRSWSLTPESPWQRGEHTIVVDPRLEDIAGNTPTRPFDLDLKTPALPAQDLRVHFTPGR